MVEARLVGPLIGGKGEGGEIRRIVSGHITAQITLTTAKHLTLAEVRSAGRVIEDPLDNDHNEKATFQPGKANVCARTNVGEGHLREMTARPEKSLMEIVPLSTNSPEIPRDVTAFKIPLPPPLPVPWERQG